MKVKELIELLQTLPQEHEVILSKDGEGNDFSPLADQGAFMYLAESTWSGSIMSKEDVEEAGEDYEYIENAIVLWPVN